jgi:nucleotide-binding universal stress UspA family protein
MDVRKILCAVDFSPPSREAFDAAVDLSLRLGARLTLFHVYPIPAYVLPDGVILPLPEKLDAIDQQTEGTLAAWCREAEARGVRGVDTATTGGLPWQEIVARARSGGYDLIVMGTHGLTGIRHVLIGSVAERVVQHAHCPVLTMRLPEESHPPTA